MTAQEIIEKIRAEIKGITEKARNTRINGTTQQAKEADAIIHALDNLMLNISDLEKEEKPMNPEAAMKELDEKIALVKQRRTWDGVDVDKYMDEVRGREPEKPIQEGLEEEIDKRYLQTRVLGYQDGVGEILLGREAFGRIARHFAQWGAEHAKKETPVTDDLEEAADEYASEPDGFIDLTAYRAFIAGAKWQAEQDQETIELAEDHAYLAGAVNEREKIMKESVEGEVTETCGIASVWIKTKQFKPGQKVRIIVCKKED